MNLQHQILLSCLAGTPCDREKGSQSTSMSGRQSCRCHAVTSPPRPDLSAAPPDYSRADREAHCVEEGALEPP
ncbi:Hypothetical protein NTJ_01673 [Nesidiocoris tenuis]|uniref:Uncharacterized protein n=1 Tax=Nesidiocoris tenuis TaxID=355587 RepID=A0ABN7AA52_9HEMI|nr:Hypothetical protein NTJ_01673 [Nesidiocoris tenuis]